MWSSWQPSGRATRESAETPADPAYPAPSRRRGPSPVHSRKATRPPRRRPIFPDRRRRSTLARRAPRRPEPPALLRVSTRRDPHRRGHQRTRRLPRDRAPEFGARPSASAPSCPAQRPGPDGTRRPPCLGLPQLTVSVPQRGSGPASARAPPGRGAPLKLARRHLLSHRPVTRFDHRRLPAPARPFVMLGSSTSRPGSHPHPGDLRARRGGTTSPAGSSRSGRAGSPEPGRSHALNDPAGPLAERPTVPPPSVVVALSSPPPPSPDHAPKGETLPPVPLEREEQHDCRNHRDHTARHDQRVQDMGAVSGLRGRVPARQTERQREQ